MKAKSLSKSAIEWEELSYKNFEIFDERKYGDTLLVFFEKV